MSCQEHAVSQDLRAARLERWERRLADAGASAWTSDLARALDASDGGLAEFVELRASDPGDEDASNEPCAGRTRPDSVAIVIHVGANARIEVARLDDAVAAWAWVERFVAWYNHEHHHSGIGFVTPDARHRGDDIDILAARRAVYEAARAKNPSRWSGPTRAWDAPALVALNPRDPQTSARAATELRVGAPSSTSTATPTSSPSTTTIVRSRSAKSIAA